MSDLNAEDLKKRMEKCPKNGTIWTHYKGRRVIVVGSALDENRLEPLVIYQHCNGDNCEIKWSRRLSDFLGHVHYEGKFVPRFSEA